MRKRLAAEYGFVIPDVRVIEEFRIPDRQYRVFIHGAVVAQAVARLGDVMVVIDQHRRPDIAGEESTEPAFGLPALWFPEGFTAELRRQGFDPVSSEGMVLTHLGETIRENLGQIFSYRDLRGILDALEPEYRRLFDDVSPALIAPSGLLSVLKALLSERISIRNMQSIIEAVAELAPQSRKIEQIIEGVRLRLAPQICFDFSDDGVLRLLRLGTRWEGVLTSAIRRDAKGEIVEFTLEPRQVEEFIKEIAPQIKPGASETPFAIAAPADVRPFVRLLTERINPAAPVLSHLEISRCRNVATFGTLS